MNDIKYECDLCQDMKHVWKNGVWERCDCFMSYETNIRYTRAGITFPSDQLYFNVDNLKKLYPGYQINTAVFEHVEKIRSKLMQKKLPGKAHCFQGGATSPKDFAVQCILKTAIDAGFRVKQSSLDNLITKYFKDDKTQQTTTMLEEFYSCDVYSLYFGSEIQINVGASYLNEIVRAHHINTPKIALILSTSLTFQDISHKYRDTTQGMFVDLSELTDDEKRVVFVSV